jgi:thiol-disulfide isomerase/thioredoxin
MSKMKIFVAALIVGIAAFLTVLATKKEPSNPKPLTQLVDADNNGVDFKAFTGKVVFVNNWASWCPPCIAEMPTIQQLKNKLKGENIVFVMVSFDDNHAKAKSFSTKKGYDFDLYFPGANYPFATSSIPATFILDKSGEVVSQHVGMADYSSDDLANQLKKLAHE